jgi:Heterokaryon incompatibility protein (HET)
MKASHSEFSHHFSQQSFCGVLVDFLFFKTPDIMSQYQYQPLSPEPNVIRLLALLPSGDEADNLRCELFEYTIQVAEKASHPYEALSYCWGSDDKPKSIVIDDHVLPVTESLYTVLKRLRDCKIPRAIWIDAICIDQEDENEKEHQIRFMAAIYAKASRVIVWLGEARVDDDRALDLIRAASERSAKPSGREPLEKAVSKLLERHWFYRIWVRNQLYNVY